MREESKQRKPYIIVKQRKITQLWSDLIDQIYTILSKTPTTKLRRFTYL